MQFSRLFCCVLTYLCLVFSFGQCLTSFHLSVSPAVVKRDLTHDVSLTCGHDGQTLSQLQNISMIKIIKQSKTGWELIAARTVANTTSRTPDRNMIVMGEITHNINNSFLQISWRVATEDTFGMYRCDVIGIGTSESSPLIHLEEQPATINDVLNLLLQTRKEMAELSRSMNISLDSIDNKITDLTDEVLTKTSAASWPAGSYALLKPMSGCPVDLTFLGGDDSNYPLHTESSSGSKNANSHSQVMPASTITANSDNQFFTLSFCESRGNFNRNRWPRGSYCINKVSGQDCPFRFEEGAIYLDLEDTNTTHNYRGNVITELGDRAVVEFCCQDSGTLTFPMRLPTTSPFLLYRKGNRCQPVDGMRATEESIMIDTEDNNNGDRTSGSVPDVAIINKSGKPIHFALCYYTRL